MVTNVPVQELLGDDNYEIWRACMETYLKSEDIWAIVEGCSTRYDKNRREKMDLKALHAIQVSCSPQNLGRIKDITSAKEAWTCLKDLFSKCPSENNEEENDYTKYGPVFKAIIEGSWEDLKSSLLRWPDALTAKISNDDRTVLIHTVVMGRTDIVKELVNLMSEQDLEAQDYDGYTALAVAAQGKITEIAKILVTKNRNLVRRVFETKEKKIPLVIASENEDEDMTRYLYDVTPLEELQDMTRHLYVLTPLEELQDKNVVQFLNHCISSGTMLDIALDLLQRYPKLAIQFDEKLSPLLVLSQMPFAFRSSSRFPFYIELLYLCIPEQQSNASSNVHGDIESPNVVSTYPLCTTIRENLKGFTWAFLKFLDPRTTKEVYKIQQLHHQSKAVLTLICREISKLDEKKFEKVGVYTSIFKAIKYGIEEVIEEVLKCHPSIFWCKDRKKRNMLSYAILKRKENIFDFLIKDKRKDLLVLSKDENENNLLHQAAILSWSELNKKVMGAVSQMQRELQWREEVEKIVQPRDKLKTNKDDKLPKTLFAEQHKGLAEDGEKWAKDTATSCSVVAALIVTIMFAAAFTIPGGLNGETGKPLLFNHNLFAVFIISDALSLFSSTTSVLMFLGILTSRYREQDFHKSLPRKLIIGLATLFFSIVTMMVAFGTTLVLVLQDKWSWVSYPVILLASGPAILYPLLHFPLLLEILMLMSGLSTFRQPKGCKFFAMWRS